MSTVHLDILGMIHNSTCIAATFNRSYPKYEMKNPYKTGAIDRSFLLDTLRHISSKFEFYMSARFVNHICSHIPVLISCLQL